MPVIDLNKLGVESKWNHFKRTVAEKAKKTLNWVQNNPETAAVITTAAAGILGGACKIGKGLVRSHNLKKEQYNKDRYIYDRSLGMYLHTRRPLRNKDYVYINNRRRNGERLSDILMSMGILD